MQGSGLEAVRAVVMLAAEVLGAPLYRGSRTVELEEAQIPAAAALLIAIAAAGHVARGTGVDLLAEAVLEGVPACTKSYQRLIS